ncbi:MAG: hypothetical protein HOP12_12590 [Candidatus Eisenbacteria bacterium]|uniref:C4-type zinc ribbon domain-containing protein n=1 Tax=Eiseniibacteriota bacterium TaxID=2212470 RepID=A0A849SK67_UNCEI|nr:hypothetical protein [Candidatus Eisenbacteria bacterium]
MWALHLLDDQLLTIAQQLARLPEEIAAIERRLTHDRTQRDAHLAGEHEQQLRHRTIEREIAAIETEARRFEGQLPLVKKNDEYQALVHEIADRKRRRSELETQLLELMDQEEQSAVRRPKLELAVAEAEASAAVRRAALEKEAGVEQARADAVNRKRVSLLETIPPATRARYERIHESRGGRALVPVAKNACSACYRALAPQALQEVKRGDRLIGCDGCGRLLIWPPDDDA